MSTGQRCTAWRPTSRALRGSSSQSCPALTSLRQWRRLSTATTRDLGHAQYTRCAARLLLAVCDVTQTVRCLAYAVFGAALGALSTMRHTRCDISRSVLAYLWNQQTGLTRVTATAPANIAVVVTAAQIRGRSIRHATCQAARKSVYNPSPNFASACACACARACRCSALFAGLLCMAEWWASRVVCLHSACTFADGRRLVYR